LKYLPKKFRFPVGIKGFYLPDNQRRLILLLILALALVLRIIALLDLKRSIYFDFLLWDERIYHTLATRIAEGSFKSSSVYEFSPLPAYVMALVYKMFSPDIFYIRIINIFLGTLTCYLLYHIGKGLGNKSTGILACLTACLYEPFIFYSIVPLKTSLALFLFALTIAFLLSALDKNSLMKTALMGISAGFLMNVRPNAIVIIPFIPLFLLWSGWKSKKSPRFLMTTFLLYAIGLFTALSPFIIRNYRVAGEFVLSTTQTGQNLYYGNNPDSDAPYYRPAPFASSSPFEEGVQFSIEASRRQGKKLTHKEASSYWTGEVIKMALESPGSFFWKLIRKILALFNRFESGDHYHIGFMSNFIGFFKFPFLSLWMVLPFGIAGMVIDGFESRKSLAVTTVFCLYGLTLVVFFISTRLRLPLLIILIPFAVKGARHLYLFIKEKPPIGTRLYVTFVIVFFVVEFLPVRATGDMTPYYNTHALILDSKGLRENAMSYWEKSSQMNRGFSVYANISLASRYFGKRNIDKAFSYLKKIPDQSFAAAHKYELLGDIMMQQELVEKAVQAYERSLGINSGQKKVLLKLLLIYGKIDERKAEKTHEQLKYVSSFYNVL
jgi:4-amino-4-deoxy-L-arabinose transferase-like glycosyltransferase